MNALISLVFAVVPMALYLWAIWAMDRYDREPIGLLITNFLWGALGAIVLGVGFSLAASWIFGTSSHVDTVVVAPVVEEVVKGMFLFITIRDSRFDNVTDGIVYGMAIGLGFGMTENFMYFLGAASVGEWVVLVIMRTLFSAVMHAMATGIFGACMGLTKFEYRGAAIPLRLLGLAIAIGMHAFWNHSVVFSDPTMVVLGMTFIALSVGVILVTIQVALMSENRLIRRELTEESELGLIPALHLNYLPYTSKRRILGWLSPTIDRRRYIQLTTRLAFRKAQARRGDERQREEYEAEIERLRDEIATMLRADEASLVSQLH